jgi:hypothetical protein
VRRGETGACRWKGTWHVKEIARWTVVTEAELVKGRRAGEETKK